MEIDLSNSRRKAIIDNTDARKVCEHNWFLYRGYAVSGINGRPVFLHRFIMDTPAGMVTDHINCNKLDSRRANLRICTNRQNILGQKTSVDNTSGYKGVSWDKGMKKWRASITVNYKKIVLGFFTDRGIAATAYKTAASLHYGEYAKLN